MARRKPTGDDPTDGSEEKHEELLRFECKTPFAIMNGHKVPTNSVIELTQEEADNHRSRGIALEDVAADDTREVFACREAYVSQGDDN